jgi:transcriptional regulator with XRE-family HTH domain
MADTTARPSKVFTDRLREVRDDRGISQAELARRMTAAGRPLGKLAYMRIENDERGLSLDEALALAFILQAAPAHLLTPAEGELVALVDGANANGRAMRNFLRFGNPFAPEVARERLSAHLEQAVLVYAQALVDAHKGKDAAGMNDALRALAQTAIDHREALEADDG